MFKFEFQFVQVRILVVDITQYRLQWVQVYSEFTFTVGSSLQRVQVYCCFKFTVGSSLQRVQVYCEFRAKFRDVQDQNCNNRQELVINSQNIIQIFDHMNWPKTDELFYS